MRHIKILLLAICFSHIGFAQEDSARELSSTRKLQFEENEHAIVAEEMPKEHVYNIKYGIDVPITAVLGGTAVYMLPIIYSKKNTSVATIESLNKNDVPEIDRWTAGWHDANLDKASYYPFYAVMPLPIILLADKQIAPDKGRIGIMYLEAFSFEGILYTSAVYFGNRFRPDVYDANLPLSYRTNGNFRNSFFAGHVAVVALSTLFVSKVYNDYHPHSKVRWVLYGSSAALTLGMAYMRLYAGKHFTSDILVGMAVGTVCGLGVPMVHKNKDYKKQKWSLSPDLFNGRSGLGMGFYFTYKL
ncbi:MAG TPA: phosphatase PAP2 family protein [Flavipsychrobacter sp.]|nr:phosphatase PAP2 family protein [Flavipsychrobacter sp.]